MPKLTAILFPLLLASSAACAQDGFEKVRCDADIPKALIGQNSTSRTISVLEKRYEKIGLKHLGADEISRQVNTISWLICGKEYIVLDARSTVRDVVEFPNHSKAFPAFSGICKVNGRDTKEAVVAVLDQAGASGDLLPAKAAWRIDEKNLRFVKMPTEGMLCPRSGISTVDGGM